MDMSSLSNKEYVNLVGHYRWLFSERGEATSQSDLKSRGYTDQQIEAVNRSKRKASKSFKVGNILFRKPLVEFKCDNLSYLLLLFENYEKGLLPFNGPVSDQPAKVIDIFNILYQVRQEYQDEQKNKLEKKNGR
jgi:hypothetical protein